MEVAVKTIFKHDIYMYRNELYKQREGGAIGLRLMGVVARLVMDRWIQIFKKKCREADVKLHMIRKYVNDVILVVSVIDEGWFWEEGRDKMLRIVWTREKEDEDKERGTSAEERTMMRIREMANTLIK